MKTASLLQFSAVSIVSSLLSMSAFAVGEATPAASTHKLDDWKIGTVLFGSKINKSELKGKVVVIENWGVYCAPCIAALPHIAEMEKKNRDKGLVVIGAESQGTSKDKIKPVIDKAKVEYTITAGASGPINNGGGIPHAYVFSRDGKLTYHGHPANRAFEEAVTKALGEKSTTPAAATASAVAAAPTALVPARSWINSDGKEFRAAVKAKDATTVTFLTDSGKEVQLPLDKLSEDSRLELSVLVQ